MPPPGPDHPITLEPAKTRWRAFFEGHVIADTNDALILHEANLGPVVYFPRDDVALEYMARTDRRTHCPHKGEASYFTLRMESRVEDNVAWSYESPYDAVGEIAGRIAFYSDRVEVYEVDDAKVNPHHRHHDDLAREDVDQIVQHTDSGDGTSQREHWAPNVEGPDTEGGPR